MLCSSLLGILLISASSAIADPRPSGFVDLQSIDPTILVDLVYYGTVNFVGRRIDGYHANVCWLSKEAANELRRAQARLQIYGRRTGESLSLRLRDCYRPKKAVAHFHAWVLRPDQLEMKPLFYPTLTKQEILDQGYIAGKSGHSRGSTVDLTIARRKADGDFEELPMGTRVDFFGERSHTGFPGLTSEERANRALLMKVLGPKFKNYWREWWHFTLADEPYPRTYFDFDVEAATP